MTGPPRDWDKEMAEIDRLIAKEPAGPRPAAVPARRPGAAPDAAPAGPVRSRGREALAVWTRVLLGALLAAGVGLAWPYEHSCGMALYLYFGATLVVAVAGVWGALASWRRRMGLAHVLALLVLLAGLLLAGKVVLDRTGYPGVPVAWACSS
jgi:hypothetical protein